MLKHDVSADKNGSAGASVIKAIVSMAIFCPKESFTIPCPLALYEYSTVLIHLSYTF